MTVKVLVLEGSIWNYLTVCKQMNSGLFLKWYLQTIYLQILYIWYMYKLDLALNDLQQLICHKIQPNYDLVLHSFCVHSDLIKKNFLKSKLFN